MKRVDRWMSKTILADQIKRYDYLYPRQNAQEVALTQKKKKLRMCLLLLVGGILFVILFAVTKKDPEQTLPVLVRDAFLGQTRQVKLEVTELDPETGKKKTYRLPVSVQAKGPTPAQLEEMFRRAKLELMEKLSAQTELTHVDRDLELDSELSGDITVEWRSSQYDVISGFGHLGDLLPPGGVEVKLHATLKYEIWKETMSIPLVVFPRNESDKSIRDRLVEHITKQMEEEPNLDVVLPEQIGDVSLTYDYITTKQEDMALLCMLFLVAILFVYFGQEKETQKQMEKRKESLEADYPELVSKLTLLLGAGLTVPLAWKKMVEDYEKTGATDRYGYEEMRRALVQLQSGVFEKDVYAEFGRRCELHHYLKLGTYLEENCQSGVRNLIPLLHEEMNLCLENRLTIAKRKGETARTRLLFPMLILMLVVMLIVLVPAWLVSGI